jgi:4'-phosphopantetheinyl transferase
VEQIDSSQIHLWLAFLDEIRDPRLLEEYRRVLSEEEREKQQRFHFERDRHRYLVTRAMVRTVLSRYAAVGVREWRFEVNAYGKPSIAPEHSAARGIEFNISHTDGLVAVGVVRERAIGVDVENVRSQPAALEIADRFFAPTEVNDLCALPSAQQPQRFFQYWTLKESYIKALGVGLSRPLDSFAFNLDEPSHIRLNEASTPGASGKRWAFWQFRCGCEHLGAVCVGLNASGQPSLSPPHIWPPHP